MKAEPRRLRYPRTCILLCVILASSACVVEKIDAIIAEHGVTYWPSSTGDDSAADTSTSTTGTTGTSTSTSDSHAGSQSETMGSSTTNEASTNVETGASSSTGAVGPVCGDGVVEGDEACDDGNANPDDGCKECTKDSIVFITSEAYQGFKLGGLYGADQRCRSLAAKAGLLRFETFRAWLSLPAMAATDRLLHSPGRYKLVNGLVIAQDWASLASGKLQNTITVDEKSQTQDSRVWTGTLADGQPALGSEFCSDWDDDSGFVFYGGSGRSLAADSAWSFYEHGECGSEYRLYCVEE